MPPAQKAATTGCDRNSRACLMTPPLGRGGNEDDEEADEFVGEDEDAVGPSGAAADLSTSRVGSC